MEVGAICHSLCARTDYFLRKSIAMNQQEAQRVALEYLESRAGVDPELQLEILEQATIEKPYGWVFFYQSKKYLKTGSIV